MAIDIPKHQKHPSYTGAPVPIDSPQHGKPSSTGWFKRDKKRDSSISQPPVQAPQLPPMNIGPSVPVIAPKLASTSPMSNGIASPARPPKQTLEPNMYSRPDQISNNTPMAPPVVPPKPSMDLRHPMQVPGQGNKPPSLPPIIPVGTLPTIRPSSPLLTDVLNEAFANRRNLKLEEAPPLESPKRDKSPVRQPVVNTFLLQAQQLEERERQEKSASIIAANTALKIGRQLSATSSAASAGKLDVYPSSQSPEEDILGSSKSGSGFFSHFRKRARKRTSVNGEEGPEISSMPVSPIPQLRVGVEKSLRNSVVMEDFYEDAQESLDGELLRAMKQADYAMAAGYRPSQHIMIAPSPVKGHPPSHPPSSHKLGVPIPPLIAPTIRHVPSPYPSTVPTPPILPPLAIPRRASSRAVTTKGSDVSRRLQASPLPQINDDAILIPGAYPLSASPEATFSPDLNSSTAMSRSDTNSSLCLPGAYPRERGSRYNSSSSGLSSAASYQTAFDPETWDSEEQKQRDEQMALQQSLMEATRAMRALEKHPYTDWTESSTAMKNREKFSGDETTLLDNPTITTWPTPPYIEGEDKRIASAAQGKVVSLPIPPIPPRTQENYLNHLR
jgi:hypothetical protein